MSDAIDVLLVERDGAQAARVRGALEGTPFTVQEVDSLSVARAQLETTHVDVVIVDLAVDRQPGYDTLRAVLGAGRLPILALTDPDDAEPLANALAEGAHEYLAKDELAAAFVTRCLRFAMERHRLESELERLAHGDPLTGLRNRRYWFKALDAAFAAGRRHGHPLSLVVADIDRFKDVNDTHGHSIGDDVLQVVAGVLTEGLRTEDTAARYGGDEFCILLPHVDRRGALRVVGRLSRLLAQRSIGLLDGGTLSPSLTFGVAQLQPHHRTSRDLFDEADQALYCNKRRGRWAHPAQPSRAASTFPRGVRGSASSTRSSRGAL